MSSQVITATVSMAAAAVVAFILTAILGRSMIPWLHKLKFGQTILDIGPSWHKNKQGTPTMGGIMFIISICASGAIFLLINTVMKNPLKIDTQMHIKLWAGIIMALAFGIIGFADDYIKVVKKRNLGLTIPQKSIAQIVVCAAYLAALYFAMGKAPYMYIPFVGQVKLGIWFWILGVCVLYGAINAVNFTDGIDGLCASVTVTCAAGFVVIAIMRSVFGMGILASALMGGCAGFLVYNHHPAKVFMGDTGSMFLGGMVVALAYIIDCPLILVLLGIIYVIEAMSDVIQIGYFKLTHGKRIFRMAPIHHHFEMGGWSENKIVTVFCIVNIIGCIIGVILMNF